MTDHTEKNHSIAKALGFKRVKYGCLEYWELPVKETSEVLILSDDEWKPWTDMNQAADFLIPVLGEMNKGAKLDILGSYIRCKWSHHKTTGEWIHGEGLKFSELIASAMCMVFLQVAKEYPELLKEALERLAA